MYCRKPCSFVEIVLCMAIIVGAAFVSQPSFIFGSIPKTPFYYVGASMALTVALGAGIFTVLSAKCKDVPTEVFMMAGGVFSLFVGPTFCFFFPNAVGYV